ncbi:hypothetical protein BH20VER3_BH20VER3_05580 [soil metagenome]
MNGMPSLKQYTANPVLVGVIASRASLARAIRLRRPPDFFELRLDALRPSLDAVERAIPRLRAPLILTARHPAEGGQGDLESPTRRALLRRFLEHPALVDIELRSVPQMKTLLLELRRRRIGLLISVHCLKDTPPIEELHRLAKSAAAARPAFLKIVTRTDKPAQLARLISFFLEAPAARYPLAVMGMGKLGLQSRLRLDRLGSALTYVSLGEPNSKGQPSLSQLRRARRAYIR